MDFDLDDLLDDKEPTKVQAKKGKLFLKTQKYS